MPCPEGASSSHSSDIPSALCCPVVGTQAAATPEFGESLLFLAGYSADHGDNDGALQLALRVLSDTPYPVRGHAQALAFPPPPPVWQVSHAHSAFLNLLWIASLLLMGLLDQVVS